MVWRGSIIILASAAAVPVRRAAGAAPTPRTVPAPPRADTPRRQAARADTRADNRASTRADQH